MQLLQAQTERLTSKTDVVSRATAKATPRAAAARGSDGSKLLVRRNKPRSDVWITGKAKDGTAYSVRFTTRWRAFTARTLQLSCMAKFEAGGKPVGKVVLSSAIGSRVIGGLGAIAGGRYASVVLELDPAGKLAVRGSQKGLAGPQTLDATIDPAMPHDGPLSGWLAAAVGNDLPLHYFAPLLDKVAAHYHDRIIHVAAAVGMNTGSVAAAIRSLLGHGERALSAPVGGGGSGGRDLAHGALACAVGAAAGVPGGPIGALFGCLGGFDVVMGTAMIDEAANAPPASSGGNPGQGGNAPYVSSPSGDDDDGWGGVCGEGDVGGEGAVNEGGGGPDSGTGGPDGGTAGPDGGTDGPGGGDIGGGGCFVAGTPVATPYGPIAIEQLIPRGYVWGEDPARTVQAPCAVRRVVDHRASEILELAFELETIRCTAPHPFFTGEWTRAGDLAPGARVLRRDGTWCELRTVTRLPCSEPVFDLAVTDLHTFFVGTSELLVHNKEPVDETDPWTDPGDDGAD